MRLEPQTKKKKNWCALAEVAQTGIIWEGPPPHALYPLLRPNPGRLVTDLIVRRPGEGVAEGFLRLGYDGEDGKKQTKDRRTPLVLYTRDASYISLWEEGTGSHDLKLVGQTQG